MEGSPALILPVLFKLNEMLTFSRDDATQTLGNPNVTTGNAILLQFPVRAVKVALSNRDNLLHYTEMGKLDRMR